MQRPIDYNVPEHDEWRPHQLEAVQWGLEIGNFGILGACTGSGKSATAKAMTSSHKTVVLTRTKFLQDQYGALYNATILKGMNNYLCVHPDATPLATCAECLMAEEGMHKCKYSTRCKYLNAKHDAIWARFCCTSYAYYMRSIGFRERCKATMLVLDEAHNVPEQVLDLCGTKITERRREYWGLPKFVNISSDSGGDSLILIRRKPENTVDKTINWLTECTDVLGKKQYWLQKRAKDLPDNRKQARRCEYFIKELTMTIVSMRSCDQGWYIKSGPSALSIGLSSRPGFMARPLSARHHFGSIFDGDHVTLAMSATVGNPQTLAEELGVEEYVSRFVPSQWSPESRAVHVLDVPRLGYKSTLDDYEAQADGIANALKELPKDWSGVIHVTRKSEAPLLADRLGHRGFANRVWIPPIGDGKGGYLGTEGQITAWELTKKKMPGALMIAWQFWEGLNGLDEKICIVAKTPFPYLGDPYERARQRYSGKMYLQRTAWLLEQACGRTRRGREEDYDVPGERRGYVAIADSNWRRVQKYLSSTMRESLVTQRGKV